MQPISSVKLQTSNVTTTVQRVSATKENLEPEDQVTLGSTHETPDFLQVPRKYKHSTLENITNGIKKVTTSVIDTAKLGAAIGWVGSLAALGPLGAVVGVPAAIIGGAAGAAFGLLTAPANGHGI